MTITGVKEWRSVLVIAPMVVGAEQELLRAFTLDLKTSNPQVHIDVLHWHGDKKRAKSKEYVRLVNEINDSDFSWLGKFTNTQLLNYFSDPYDCVMVLVDQLPEKIKKLIHRSKASLKLGFEEDERYTIVFQLTDKELSRKLQTLRKHFLTM
jgi:hypothetical protein